MNFCFFVFFTVPTPIVNVIPLSPPTVGQSLTLECRVMAVRGITGRIDIIWRSGGVVLIRSNDTSPSVKDAVLIYSGHYGIPHVLNVTDDGREYQCEVVINTSPLVMATGSVTLDVIGKNKKPNNLYYTIRE